MANPENAAENTYDVAQVTDSEAVNIQALGEDSLKEGKQFIYREKFSRNTTNANLKVLLELPPSATDSIRVIAHTIESNKALVGNASFNVGVDVRGTGFRYTNARISDSMNEPASVNVEYGGTYTKSAGGKADALPVDVLDSGTGANRRSLNANRASFRLTPGSNILFDLNAQSDATTIVVEFVVSERTQIE